MSAHAQIPALARRRISRSQLQRLQDRIHAWHLKTFPGQPAVAKLKHLVKEITTELIPDIKARAEWADVFILFLCAAAMEGLTADDLIQAAHHKMDINVMRKWSKPDKDGVIEHIRESTR